MTKKRVIHRAPPLHALHVFFAIASIALFIATIGKFNLTASQTTQESFTTILVEHQEPLALTLRATAGKMPGILDISHDASTGALLHVPENWTVREVRGARVTDVISAPPLFGSRRFTIPARATVSFTVPLPGNVRIQNPSGIPLLIRTIVVSLPDGKTTDDSVLITTKPAVVW